MNRLLHLHYLKIGIGLCLVFSPISGLAHNSDQDSIAFFKKPTLKLLPKIQESCRKGQLSSDLLDQEFKNLLKNPNEAHLRAWITIYEHCSDGALAEDIRGILGVDILLKHPRSLIHALSLEKMRRTHIQAIAQADGTSGEGLFLDCDRSCLPKIEKFYSKKAYALKNVDHIGAQEQKIRDQLLQEVEKAKKEWRKRLPK
jgi:hypothetical protein